MATSLYGFAKELSWGHVTISKYLGISSCFLMDLTLFKMWWELLTTAITFSLQAIINSTITPNMTFTKTSQKFGQWADSRANTVYGLGFSSEHHLSKVSKPCFFLKIPERYGEKVFSWTVRVIHEELEPNWYLIFPWHSVVLR